MKGAPFSTADGIGSLPFREIILERVKYRSEIRFSRTALEGMELLTHIDHTGDLVVRLDAQIWADPPKVIRCEWPATWWERFKARWCPAWAVRRWPVRMESRELMAQTIYPNLVSDQPEHIPMLRMLVKGVK